MKLRLALCMRDVAANATLDIRLNLGGVDVDQIKRLFTTACLALRGRVESRVPFWSERTIRRRQTRNLRRIVAHAFRYVPYYQDLAKSHGFSPRDFHTCDDLARLPLIDGRTLQQDPLAFASTAFPLSSLVKLFSTGTAAYGTKTVYWHPRLLLSGIAYGERDRSILRQLVGKSHGLVRLSFFHPDSSTSTVGRFHTARLLVPRAIMKTHWASSDLPYTEVAQLFNDIKPDVVYSYGSFAESFLLYVLDHGLAVYLPRVWIFGGDGMSEEGRQRIEETLECILYSTYQAIETGRIGFECEMNSGYHINTDLCHVRLVNEDGETVSPGEIGKVVISNLCNPGSILLNYLIGDYASWSTEPCSCGRTLPLLHLTGARTSSFLRLRDGRELQEHVLLHACKEGMHDVFQFQVIEKDLEVIIWRVVLSQNADREEVISNLITRSCSVMSPEADVSVDVVDRIVLPPGSKLTRIVRRLADQSNTIGA